MVLANHKEVLGPIKPSLMTWKCIINEREIE